MLEVDDTRKIFFLLILNLLLGVKHEIIRKILILLPTTRLDMSSLASFLICQYQTWKTCIRDDDCGTKATL